MNEAGPASRAATIDTVEVLLGVVVLVIAAISLAGILLAEAGMFAAAALAAGAAAILVVLIFVCRRWRPQAARRQATPARDWTTLATVAVLAGALFTPPADAIVEGGDGSVYLAIGRIVAGSGGLRTSDPLLQRIPRSDYEELFSADRLPPARLNLFPGGIQLTPDGIVEPNFFHLAPVWMAALETFLGPRGPGLVSPLFGVLAAAFVWAIARRLSGSAWAGVAAAALLAASFGEMWFARYPTAEVMTQAFVAASLLFLLVMIDTSVPAAGLIAGIAVGLVAFSRIDGLIMVTAPLLLVGVVRMLASRGDSRKSWTVFLIAGVAVTAFAILHAWLFSVAYTTRLLNLMLRRGWRTANIAVPTVVLAALMVVAWMVRGHLRLPPRATRGLLVVAGVAAVGIGWIAGPRVIASPVFLLITPLAGALAVAGVIVLVGKDQKVRSLPITIVFLASALVYLQNPLDMTVMPMPLRRFVPVVLPIAAVLTAIGLWWIGRMKWLRGPAIAACVGLVAVGVARARPLFGEVPFEGARSEVERVARAIPPGALTVVDPAAPSHLALALHYQFDRPSLVPTGPLAHGALERAATSTLGKGQAVRLIAPAQGSVTDGFSVEDFGALLVRPVLPVRIEFPVFAPNGRRLPEGTMREVREIVLYEVRRAVTGDGRLPLRVDVGSHDFGWLQSGFHTNEMMQGTMARWTERDARIVVPPLQVVPGTALIFSCRLAAPRPQGMALPSVEILVNGRVAGVFEVSNPGFTDYRVSLAQEATQALLQGGTITLRSATFVPAESGGSEDRRTLGIALDWVELSAPVM